MNHSLDPEPNFEEKALLLAAALMCMLFLVGILALKLTYG